MYRGHLLGRRSGRGSIRGGKHVKKDIHFAFHFALVNDWFLFGSGFFLGSRGTLPGGRPASMWRRLFGGSRGLSLVCSVGKSSGVGLW